MSYLNYTTLKKKNEIIEILLIKHLNKMKRIIFFIIIILPLCVYSQEPLSYSEVVEVPTTDRNELFIRGREWFNENFKSSKDVLQIIDKETGELAGKAYMEVTCTFNMMGAKKIPAGVHFLVNLWIKDGKYKYEISNFTVPGENDGLTLRIGFGQITTSNEANIKVKNVPQKRLNEAYLSIKHATEQRATFLIENLKEKMSKSSKSSDW